MSVIRHTQLRKIEHQMKTPDLKNHNQNLYLDFPYLAEHCMKRSQTPILQIKVLITVVRFF